VTIAAQDFSFPSSFLFRREAQRAGRRLEAQRAGRRLSHVIAGPVRGTGTRVQLQYVRFSNQP